jgi:phage integrase
MTAVLRDVDRGTYQTPSKMTVKIWMETWLDTFCTGLKPLTVSAYNTAMKTHIVPAFGAMPVQELKGIHVQKLFNDMLEAGKSPKTVKNTAAILHKALSVAVKQGYIAANPCDAAEVPKVTRHEIKPLTDAEIPVFLAAIEDHPFRNAYGLCLFAGLREGECLGLTWDCVDFERGRITVRQQLQKSRTESGTYRIVSSTKSGKVRVIEPPVVAFDYLRSERTRQVENRLRAGKLWDNAQDLVFTNPLGGHVVIETFRRNFKRLAASMGRPDLRPHDLRHTCATVAIAAGADIKSVQSLMGHATASFTLDVYAHTSETMMADTASRMQSYYDNLAQRG